MATYYVKNGGNDELNGLSDENAWATISKVNAKSFSAVDIILFKRGSTWREQLSNGSDGETGNYITYSAYDTGDNPKILGSLDKSSTGDWSDEGSNIWACTDNNFGDDVGNLIFNNEALFGTKKSVIGSVTAQGDFYYDVGNTKIQLYSTSNPGSFYSHIECARKTYGIESNAANYVIFENFNVRYCGQHGIGPGASHHAIIRDNHIAYIGGCYLYGAVRYGNGIETWQASHDIEAYRNIIENCYDAGVTAQGSASGYSMYNQYFYNNLIKKCEYNIEFFVGDDSTAEDVYFENNTCRQAGEGWAHSQRTEPGAPTNVRIGDVHGKCTDCYVRNNIFYKSTQNAHGASISFDHNDDADDITFDYNQYYEDSGRVVEIWFDPGATYDYATEFGDWQTDFNQDLNSQTGNPLFQSGEDIKLESNSPCKNQGTTPNDKITEDYYETSRPQGTGYDIGAYEIPEEGAGNKIVLILKS